MTSLCPRWWNRDGPFPPTWLVPAFLLLVLLVSTGCPLDLCWSVPAPIDPDSAEYLLQRLPSLACRDTSLWACWVERREEGTRCLKASRYGAIDWLKPEIAAVDTDGRRLGQKVRCRAALLDIMGRRVVELRPGENDILRVALGCTQ